MAAATARAAWAQAEEAEWARPCRSASEAAAGLGTESAATAAEAARARAKAEEPLLRVLAAQLRSEARGWSAACVSALD